MSAVGRPTPIFKYRPAYAQILPRAAGEDQDVQQ
jgi:hypothetical protein